MSVKVIITCTDHTDRIYREFHDFQLDKNETIEGRILRLRQEMEKGGWSYWGITRCDYCPECTKELDDA